MGNKSYSKGITWIDDCRIPTNNLEGTYHDNTKGLGRFPANLLVSDDMLNDGVVSKSTIFDGKLPNIKGGRFGASDVELTDKRAFGGYDDKGSSSRYYDLDKWFDMLIND